MPQYRVLRPVEHGTTPDDQKLYLPQGSESPEKVKSAGRAEDVPVDVSGLITLDEKQAAAFPAGVIEPVKPPKSKAKAEK